MHSGVEYFVIHFLFTLFAYGEAMCVIGKGLALAYLSFGIGYLLKLIVPRIVKATIIYQPFL